MTSNEPKNARHSIHTEQSKHSDMNNRTYRHGADVVIVGAGAAGGVLARDLSKAGLKVVVIEAGPFWDPQQDFASDELATDRLGWQDTRIVAGSNTLTLGKNNSGRGVGGGTTHFTGVFLRFHESDFVLKSRDGVAEDWPIRYQDLAPYYDRLEKEIGVSGPKHYPWGEYSGPYPLPEREPLSANAEMFRVGCDKLGIKSVVTPLAIISAPFKGRPPCINRGFCNQGCMPNSKFSTLIHHVPEAIKSGSEVLTDCMVTEVSVNDEGRATGVVFYHEGYRYHQEARIVILANFVIETPRLLLNSVSKCFPNGLANSSGWVGVGIMPHSSQDVYARFPEEIRLYKGTPVLATTQDFYETDATRGFVRGYTLHAHGARPVEMASGLARGAKVWGRELKEAMLNYNFYGRVTLVGEVLPSITNKVTLDTEKDEYGMPRAKVTFSYGENDKRLIEHAVLTMERILSAAGGAPEFVVNDTAHLMGGCRMGSDPERSVVNEYCQSHDVPNLFICSAAVFVTSGGGNPTETVLAIASRTAEHIIQQCKIQRL